MSLRVRPALYFLMASAHFFRTARGSLRCLPSVSTAMMLGFILLASSIPAEAARRNVEVRVSAGLDESEAALLDRALAQGLEAAVFDEALAILPGILEQTRQDILERYLRDRAKTLIHEYTVVSERRSDADLLLTLDVAVNSPQLRRLLQDLGVWYTLSGRIAFQLTLRGVAPYYWEQINALQALSGLTLLAGADPSLSLELHDATWSARLKGKAGTWLDSDRNLGDLWARIWGRYFRGTELPAFGSEAYLLVVSGFTSAQEPYAFNAELDQVQGVTVKGLREISLSSNGISASWTIDAQNHEAVERQLETLAGRHGLTWRMELP